MIRGLCHDFCPWSLSSWRRHSMCANVPIKDIIFWSVVTRLVICLYKPMSDEECPYPIPWCKHIPMVPIMWHDSRKTHQPTILYQSQPPFFSWKFNIWIHLIHFCRIWWLNPIKNHTLSQYLMVAWWNHLKSSDSPVGGRAVEEVPPEVPPTGQPGGEKRQLTEDWSEIWWMYGMYVILMWFNRIFPFDANIRRKFRSQTSDNMDRWKAEQGRGREKRKIRREKIREEKESEERRCRCAKR